MGEKNVGRFVWFDLMVPDAGAAKEFYGNVIGWTTRPFGDGSSGYEMWTVDGDNSIGGVIAFTEETKQAGMPPHWLGYVSVEDVDATVAKAQQLGGNVMKPADDIPEVGRFAIITDPQGAAIAIYGSAHDFDKLPDDMPPKHVGWSELATDDWRAAKDFYAKLFGWVESDTMDMGDGNMYSMFKVEGMGSSMGGMFDRPKEMPVSAWLYYIEVEDLDATIEKVKAGGGQIVNGPMEVPGGSRIAQCVDPQGAMFALHSKG